MEYRFVPGLQRTYTGEIRAHVLHHSDSGHFKKNRVKKKARRKDDDDVVEEEEESDACPAGVSLIRNRPLRKLLIAGDTFDSTQINDSSVHNSTAGRDAVTLSQTLIFPTSFDPLDALPLPKYSDRYFLAHNYLHTLVSTYYRTHGRARWNPNMLLFHEGIGDGAYMSIALTVSARHHEKLNGLSSDNSLKWEATALRTLNGRIKKEGRLHGIGTVVSILGFIALDLEFPIHISGRVSTERLATHIRGLRNIIEMKGGVEALSEHPFFDWIFHWLDICASGALSAGLTPLSVHILSAASQASAKESCTIKFASVRPDLQPFVQELIGFYTNMYTLAESGEADSIRFTFQQNSMFHNLLKDRPQYSNAETWVNAHGSTLLLSAIVYLNGLIYELRDSPERLENTLLAYRHAFVDEAVDIHTSECVLMWVLITDRKTSRIANHQLTWLAARALRVASHCDPDFSCRLKHRLLAILMADVTIYRAWTPELFARDLLQSLSAGG